MALYALADLFMVTPLIDGMNLMAKEYFAAKPTQSAVIMSRGEVITPGSFRSYNGVAVPPGYLILSKFAGAAAQYNEVAFNAFMKGANRNTGKVISLVDPYEPAEMQGALYEAL